MKLKKIKKNIAKLPLEKQIKLANWVDKFIKDAQNNPALAGKVEQETTESI
jgi:hypothetical protein